MRVVLRRCGVWAAGRLAAPPGAGCQAQALAWVEAKKVDPSTRAKAETVWSDLPAATSEDELLVRLARTFALLDPSAAKLVKLCSEPRSRLVVPAEAWLRNGTAPPLFAANLRLLYARWLVHESLFDEAQEQLSGLGPADVVAPASLLFYQSVIYHALLNKESGLKSLGELLAGADLSPRRYVALGRLMEEDLKGLQDDTLDHIARRMDDIRRRLDLGRAGPKVRKEEDGVIKSLDKMIKKLEEQQRESQAGGNANSIRSSNPARDSLPLGGKGPGEVAKKDIGSGSGWGDLPPKEREEAMQQIGRDFPSQYRDAIEQYFRRLAAERRANKGVYSGDLRFEEMPLAVLHANTRKRMNAILVAILLTAAAPPFEVQMLDGQTLVGPLVELTADRLTIDAADNRVSLETENGARDLGTA